MKVTFLWLTWFDADAAGAAFVLLLAFNTTASATNGHIALL